MTQLDIMKVAFEDELEKISGTVINASHRFAKKKAKDSVKKGLKRAVPVAAAGAVGAVAYKKLKGKKKTAGELQGHTRIGKRPISASRLLEKETEASESVDEVLKLSAPKNPALGTFGAGALLGAGGLHVLRQANDDRKLGRQLRIQQNY